MIQRLRRLIAATLSGLLVVLTLGKVQPNATGLPTASDAPLNPPQIGRDLGEDPPGKACKS